MSDLSWFKPEENRQPEFAPIPPGKYAAVIADSELKPTKDGNGSYLQLRFVLVDGEFRNRSIYSRLNIHNANQQAQSIARGQLAAICDAVGVPSPQNSEQLKNIPLEIEVIFRKDRDGNPQTDIRRFAKLKTNSVATNGSSDTDIPF